jgi:hypothetical protein
MPAQSKDEGGRMKAEIAEDFFLILPPSSFILQA